MSHSWVTAGGHRVERLSVAVAIDSDRFMRLATREAEQAALDATRREMIHRLAESLIPYITVEHRRRTGSFALIDEYVATIEIIDQR
jgi:ribosomal protein S7